MKDLRKVATGMAAIVLFAATALFINVRAHTDVVRADTDVPPSDTAAYYKTKCVACHGKTAEKKFDATLSEEQMIDAILKGKKGQKPPNMPGYGAKGVSSDHAKALIAHMKQLKAGQ